jgi:hypothetical protein
MENQLWNTGLLGDSDPSTLLNTLQCTFLDCISLCADVMNIDVYIRHSYRCTLLLTVDAICSTER